MTFKRFSRINHSYINGEVRTEESKLCDIEDSRNPDEIERIEGFRKEEEEKNLVEIERMSKLVQPRGISGESSMYEYRQIVFRRKLNCIL